MEDFPPPLVNKPNLDQLVGTAVKSHRLLAGLTLAELSRLAKVSTAMISKIERGQVSASLNTLGSLAEGIGIPVLNFFAETVERTDVSFVAAGEGMTVQRLGSGFGQIYKLIGRAEADHVSFECFNITLEAPLKSRPLYQHRGIEFIHITSGEMTYGCGDAVFHMTPGDSISFDSSTAHGPIDLKTETVSFITVISKAEASRL